VFTPARKGYSRKLTAHSKNKRVKGVRNVAKLIKALARCEVVEGEMVARRV
jgi:hypothetical protein